MHQRPALRLRREHRHEADEVAGEAWPQARCHTPGALHVRLLDAKNVPFHAAAAFIRVSTAATTSSPRSGAPNIDVAASDCRDDGPAAGFDVITPQAMLGAMKRRSAFDTHGRRPVPEMPTPSFCRKLQSSTTCGSQAA